MIHHTYSLGVQCMLIYHVAILQVSRMKNVSYRKWRIFLKYTQRMAYCVHQIIRWTSVTVLVSVHPLICRLCIWKMVLCMREKKSVDVARHSLIVLSMLISCVLLPHSPSRHLLPGHLRNRRYLAVDATHAAINVSVICVQRVLFHLFSTARLGFSQSQAFLYLKCR